MLTTKSAGWKSLHILRAQLTGKLARFSRNGRSAERPPQLQNDAAFLEADLRYIFTIIPLISHIPDHQTESLDQRAQDLLSTWTRKTKGPGLEGLHGPAKTDLIALGSLHPQLGSLLILISTTDGQFNLFNGQGLSLFRVPEEKLRSIALDRVARTKELLERLANDGQPQESLQLKPPPPLDVCQEEPWSSRGLHGRHASAWVSTLFQELRQRNCGRLHEIKLKVQDEWDTPLDLFLSCCLDEHGWHQAKCGIYQAMADERRDDGICAAIQRAKTLGRAIYLSIDERGSFDVSDAMPRILSSATRFTAETLGELLDQKTLTRITPSDYLTGAAVDKFSSREKAILALNLAKCLMQFFDDDIELASHSWKPESIYFLRSSRAQHGDRSLYISLRPSTRNSKPSQSVSEVGPGNPILLSFAKLLLEIENGEKISMEIYPESRANLPNWGGMCDLVDRAERDGGGSYLRAVEGCLYLHMALRKSQHQSTDNIGDAIRKTIHEQIVQNLELLVNPQTSKRKRRDSVSELHISKKLSVDPGRSDPVTPPPRQTTAPHPAKSVRPASRSDFEIAIVCALPLEFDAVCALVDEFWDGDYGRGSNDLNIYTNARIGKFNVVLLLLPNMGKVAAAGTAAHLRSSYPALSLVLLTGICGGVPFPSNGEELLLGDVVISRRIVPYDFGRRYPDKFEPKDAAEDSGSGAPKNVRNLLAMLQTNVGRERLEELTVSHLQDIQARTSRKPRGAKYKYPGASKDRLFKPDYRHKRHASLITALKTPKVSICAETKTYGASCEDACCDPGQVLSREQIDFKRQLEKDGETKAAQAPSIFVGRIGSGDTVMKSGEERDKLASAHDLIAFEMEGAGVWDELPCVVVKGVCDYADSHKNKDWQHFAAATAASATKALLGWYIGRASGSGA
ncbi:uncharacterized protein DSM5745_05808 [Aspergillus mulundensis]|uniref:Uncharacterized protein n=1 Tax=Aspergillus mulundensis TaxID=1810919 RepID=A0A3D8RY62_9EURO|nr:hypothetical protein DSM5745_05808 [Aspergillus mulundensis]RDW78956.1 hypothetical protein DSM5745_05808 [Aspergillus mulundensis]